jgi:DNA-binding transcriptional LysR family regulator
MEWDDLRIFLAAVRAGSYTAAARHLGINRTTVGRRIEVLEKNLGVELFHYRAASPHPTKAGEALLQAATQMEAAMLQLEAQLSDQRQPAPTIRLVASAGLASEFMAILAAFARLHPDIPLELSAELDPVDAVTHRRADLGLGILRLPPKYLDSRMLATLDQALYGAKHRSSDRRLGWGHELDLAIPAQWTSSNLSGERAEAAGLTRFNTWHELKEAVLAGMGTASLWTFAADGDDRLERLETPDPRYSYPLWLLRRASFPPSPAQQILIDFLQSHLPAELGQDTIAHQPT